MSGLEEREVVFLSAFVKFGVVGDELDMGWGVWVAVEDLDCGLVGGFLEVGEVRGF